MGPLLRNLWGAQAPQARRTPPRSSPGHATGDHNSTHHGTDREAPSFSDPSHFLRPRVSLSPQPSFQGSSASAPLRCHRFLTGHLSPPKTVSINGWMSKSFSGGAKDGTSQLSLDGPVSLWLESEFSTPCMNSICPFPFFNNYHLFPNTGRILLFHSDEHLLAGAGQHPAPPLCGRTASCPGSDCSEMHGTVHLASCPHSCSRDRFNSGSCRADSGSGPELQNLPEQKQFFLTCT